MGIFPLHKFYFSISSDSYDLFSMKLLMDSFRFTHFRLQQRNPTGFPLHRIRKITRDKHADHFSYFTPKKAQDNIVENQRLQEEMQLQIAEQEKVIKEVQKQLIALCTTTQPAKESSQQ